MGTFSVNISTTPSFVWQPVPTLPFPSTVKVTNLASAPVYAGPLSTLLTPGAFPAGIAPGAHLYLNPATAAVYVSAGYSAGTNTTTLSTAPSTAGSTSFTVASNTHFPAGTLLLLGSAASSQEVLSVASTTSTTILTTTTGSLFDHCGSATVSTATANAGQVLVTTGAQ